MAEALRLEKEPTKPVTRGAKQNVERSTNESAYAHATPSTKKKGKESRTTFMRKFEYLQEFFGKQGQRLNGTYFSDQSKYADVHHKVQLKKSQNDKDTKFRCKYCHIFKGAKGRNVDSSNSKCLFVCEPLNEDGKNDAGTCNGILYCTTCYDICHIRKTYAKNIPNVQKWLNKHGSKSRGSTQSTRRRLNSTFRNAA